MHHLVGHSRFIDIDLLFCNEYLFSREEFILRYFYEIHSFCSFYFIWKWVQYMLDIDRLEIIFFEKK